MTDFIIQTDMTDGLHSQPLFWTGSDVVGILRAAEARVYSTREEAERDLSQIAVNKVRFYGLTVVSRKNASHLPTVGGHGWLVRHPGFDPIH